MQNSRTQILIIFNPTAGERENSKFNTIVERLISSGMIVEIRQTQFAGHATEIANKLKDGDCDLVIVAGGDGTINEVINGLYPRKIPLAIIPMGTANVMAIEIGLTNNVDAIADYIVSGKVRRIWLGEVDGRYFSLMMSVGHDAKSVARVNRKLKDYIGKAAYLVSFIKSVIKSDEAVYRVSIENKIYQASSVIVSKGRFYGGNYICAQNASLTNDQLIVSMTKKSGRLHAIKYAILMFLNKFPTSSTVETIETKSLSIESNSANEPIQLDGDSYNNLPAHISVSTDNIQMLFPEISL